MPSLASSSVRRRSSGAPASRSPTRLESAETVYVVAHSASTAPAANQSSRGPGRSRSGPVGAGRGVSWSRGSPRRRPTGSTVPAASRGGPTQASVSVEREPSTAGTSIPPATAR